jgi:dolichol-phosphate mannosyltransferase
MFTDLNGHCNIIMNLFMKWMPIFLTILHDLEKLYDACHFGGADLAIGSRYVTGVNVVNWPLSRVLLSYFASVYVRMITGMKIMDATAGFICYSRQVLESII